MVFISQVVSRISSINSRFLENDFMVIGFGVCLVSPFWIPTIYRRGGHGSGQSDGPRSGVFRAAFSQQGTETESYYKNCTYPKGSMYGIFTYIWLKSMVNV